MPIIKYVAIHSTPLSNIEYILNGEKNDEMKFATGLNCTADPQSAYNEFRRVFELCAKERFFKSEMDLNNYGTDDKPKHKEKVRIHHYIQSFSPDENVTAEEAHKIGIEWAKKTFGENFQVLVSTHLDKGHLHNHFAVCPFDLNGKQWHANLTTLKRARSISDKIALEHGLHIIENPKHRNTMKYNEWLARQNGTSWKAELSDKIDELILRDDVLSLEDLSEKLKEEKYSVRLGKYFSIRPENEKRGIRSFRLGDGYTVQALQYRLLNKDKEISLAAIEQYSGVQREYALCIRQMQISVYQKKSKRVTYSDLQKSAELLNFLTSNNITSIAELENRLNSAAEQLQSFSEQKKTLSEQIAKVEKIVKDGKIYLELADKDFLTSDEKAQYKKVSYVKQSGIESIADLNDRAKRLDKLKDELPELEQKIEICRNERNDLADMYKTIQQHLEENPYNEIVRQIENKQQIEYDSERQEEEIQKQNRAIR